MWANSFSHNGNEDGITKTRQRKLLATARCNDQKQPKGSVHCQRVFANSSHNVISTCAFLCLAASILLLLPCGPAEMVSGQSVIAVAPALASQRAASQIISQHYLTTAPGAAVANHHQQSQQLSAPNSAQSWSQLVVSSPKLVATPIGQLAAAAPNKRRQVSLPSSTARQIVLVPGSIPMNPSQEEQLSFPIILPSEEYRANLSQDLQNSYIIDRKRFVEAVSTRCLASTILEKPATVEPAFILITPVSEMRLNATASAGIILAAGFDSKKRTTILVHGYTQSYPNTEWLRKARGLFELNSQVSKHNLIIMDWGVAAQGSYSQAAAYVSGMGSFLSNFLMKLIDLGSNRMHIHIVGHSLGAHLAGFAGKRIRPRLGRITALDAAGPCFGKILSNSPKDRLSPDDAFEVDAYHYDDDFLGLPGQHGQFDVLVNGGSSQPGCTDNMSTMFQAMLTMVFRRNRVLSESHTRSTEVATARLKSVSACQQVAYECRDWPTFLAGECGRCDDLNNQCFLMGFDFQYKDMIETQLRTSFPGKRFYISTGFSELFCQNHYQILVKFEPNPELAQVAKRNKWRLLMDLLTDQEEKFNATITNQVSANAFSYLLLTEMRPMRIVAAQLQIKASDGKQVPISQESSPFQVIFVEINFMSDINPRIRRSMSSRLCPTVPVSYLQTAETEDVNAIPHSSMALRANGNSNRSDNGKTESWLQFEECQ